MPNWSKEFYADYLARHKPPCPKPEQAVRNEPVGKKTGESGNTIRLLPCYVRIISYRRRLLDIDNLTGGCKYFIDCCRLSGLIPDDSPEDITLEVRQVKVKFKQEERTEIQIVSPDVNPNPVLIGTPIPVPPPVPQLPTLPHEPPF